MHVSGFRQVRHPPSSSDHVPRGEPLSFQLCMIPVSSSSFIFPLLSSLQPTCASHPLWHYPLHFYGILKSAPPSNRLSSLTRPYQGWQQTGRSIPVVVATQRRGRPNLAGRIMLGANSPSYTTGTGRSIPNIDATCYPCA